MEESHEKKKTRTFISGVNKSADAAWSELELLCLDPNFFLFPLFRLYGVLLSTFHFLFLSLCRTYTGAHAHTQIPLFNVLTACTQVRAEGWRPKRIPRAFPCCTLMCTQTITRTHKHTHSHTFWLCKPERLAAHYHTTGGLHTRDGVCMCASVCCQRTSQHCLLVITTTVPLFPVHVCQNESVFNQGDREGRREKKIQRPQRIIEYVFIAETIIRLNKFPSLSS